MFAKNITPVLLEIETAMLENRSRYMTNPDYPQEAMRAATFIFFEVLMDFMWKLMRTEQLSMKERETLAEEAGNELKDLIFKY
jgi:hypothetical protein